MKEIHALTRDEVIETVAKHLIGNYWLGYLEPDGNLHVKWIGRSLKWDKNGLQKRLLDHASEGKYTHFTFRKASSVTEAYNIECREYHILRDQLDNIRHPDSPRLLNYSCEYCNHHLRPFGRSFTAGGAVHG
tara:strand:+ start:144 stop:539 length:396 start_codon:yes stop_codon:yes gene_type:complete